MIETVKALIPNWYKYIIKNIHQYKEGYVKNMDYYESISNKKNIFFIGSAHYNNLGDQAISMATIKFLKDNFEDYNLVDIRLDEFMLHLKSLKKYIKSNDLIILQGGGNMGYMYADAEDNRRTVIHYFKKNKIIIFPQTIDYSDDERGRKEFEKSKRTYGSHSNLYILAREEKSFKIMKEAYTKNQVVLVPDIVTYLNESDNSGTRDGILLCLRNDEEGTLNSNNKKEIFEECKKYSDNIKFVDTISDKEIITSQEREQCVREKLQEFKHAGLVITDRLHGMIFSSITGTPCIVFDNYNNKVKGVYKWIEYLPYIKFSHSYKDINIEEMLNLNDNRYENYQLKDKFQEIISLIKE